MKIKHRIHLYLLTTYVDVIYNRRSKIVKDQIGNYKSIPIIIISYNQLRTLKMLVDFLLSKGYTNIVILDNCSTYKPLLEYFESIKEDVEIVKNTKNEGHQVFWKNDTFFKKYSKGYYVVTDPDVVPIDECPDDFMEVFFNILQQNRLKFKVGFSLKIDDIPDENPTKQKIINWESQFWKKKTKNGNYDADLDTTFALYRPLLRTRKSFFLKAIRTSHPYTARHYSWYIDPMNLTEEQEYYWKHSNSSSSWKIDKGGEIINENFKDSYI